MEIKFNKPKLEQLFRAEIYLSMNNKREEEYRIRIGIYGREMDPKVGEYLGLYAMSNFLNRKKIERWTAKKARELTKNNQKVKFDSNLGYLMARAFDELSGKTIQTNQWR
jgi:tRNA U55 pseudouridine synthase TruB